MIRFDYSATANEQSVRFPLSASWRHSKPLRVAVLSAESFASKGMKRVLGGVSHYGKPLREKGIPATPSIDYMVGYQGLAKQISSDLGLPLGKRIGDVHIRINWSSGPSDEQQDDGLPVSDDKNESDYLNDFKP